jgi:hypothetical protein
MNKICQKDPALKPEIQKYGCYFLSILYHSPETLNARDANVVWDMCVRRGIITGDLNGDGDVDDANESLLTAPQKLLDMAQIPAKFDGRHHAADEAVPENAAFAIGGFSRAGSGVTHFVVIDRAKNVLYDPLGASLSVRDGRLATMRLFFPKGAA